MVTMKDVAAAAGVSSAAVSYAYTRPEKLSEPQRLRILEIAKSLGYLGPHPGAASLRRGKVGAMGLMITDSLPYAFEDPATALLLHGIAQVGELAEVALTLLPFPSAVPSSPNGSGSEDRARLALQVLVDGFLIYTMPEGHPAVDAALSRSLPTVIIDSPPMKDVAFVGIADAKGAELAAEHLLSLGHKRFLILVDRLIPDGHAGPVDKARIRRTRDTVGGVRVKAYLKALAKAGIRDADISIIEAGGFLSSHATDAARMAIEHGSATAVLASTDVLALAFLDEARLAGMSVPGDVSVVGFDNLPAAQSAALTSIAQPLVDKGRVAAELLIELLNGGAPRKVILPTELVVAGTTAQPGRGIRRQP